MGQSVDAPNSTNSHTVKEVTCGPEVDSGRCPNLGFFFSFGAVVMMARMRGAWLRFRCSGGRRRYFQDVHCDLRSEAICTSTCHKLFSCSFGELRM